MNRSRLLVLVLLPCVVMVTLGMDSKPPTATAPDHDEDKFYRLRRLSLDLRGRPPSVEEAEALANLEDIPAEWVGQWMASDDFRDVMRRYHEQLLWPNLSQVELIGIDALSASASTDAGPGPLRMQSLATAYRQGTFEGACGEQEQTQFDPAYPGEFRPLPSAIVAEPLSDGGTVLHEGWRWVTPYWNKNQKVRVCAFDAQESLTAKNNAGASVDCSTNAGNGVKGCGCGPNLRWCYASYRDPATGELIDSEQQIRDAVREQLAKAYDDVTIGKKPYTALLEDPTAYENGPIRYWKDHLSRRFGESTGRQYYLKDTEDTGASREWSDTEWRASRRPGLHSGVLTMPGFLMRFGSNRSRANRFRNAFLCQSYIPSDEVEDPVRSGCDPNAEDLMQRCTCRTCHVGLEPLAAHWGQFAENGVHQMTDPKNFPLDNPLCKSASPSLFCKRFYVTNADEYQRGRLRAWQWAQADALHAPVLDAIQGGPAKMAKEAIQSGAFARCTVRRVFHHFIGRDLRTDEAEGNENALLEALTDRFVGSGYDFRKIVREVIALPQYRRTQ